MQKKHFWENRGKQILIVENEKNANTNYSSKKELHIIEKRESNYTIDKKLINMVIKF